MERTKTLFKRTTAMLLTVILFLTTFSCLSSITADALTEAASIGSSTTSEDIEEELSQYGDVITNEELGEVISYSGYITKAEYREILEEEASSSKLRASSSTLHPYFNYTYNTNGDIIKTLDSVAKQKTGSYAWRITKTDASGTRLYCIEPGQPLRSVSTLTESSDTWDNLVYCIIDIYIITCRSFSQQAG